MLPVSAPSETTPVAVQAFISAPEEAAIGSNRPGTQSAMIVAVAAKMAPATSSWLSASISSQSGSVSNTEVERLRQDFGSTDPTSRDL